MSHFRPGPNKPRPTYSASRGAFLPDIWRPSFGYVRPDYIPQNPFPVRGKFPPDSWSRQPSNNQPRETTLFSQEATTQSINQRNDRLTSLPNIENLTLSDEAFPALSAQTKSSTTSPVTASGPTNSRSSTGWGGPTSSHSLVAWGNPTSSHSSVVRAGPISSHSSVAQGGPTSSQPEGMRNDSLKTHSDGRRAGQSRMLDFSTLLGAVEKSTGIASQSEEASSKTAGVKSTFHDPNIKGNALDSSVPTRLRGKEKAIPKKKKPSALKKAIIKSRQQANQQPDSSRDAEKQIVDSCPEETNPENLLPKVDSRTENASDTQSETAVIVKDSQENFPVEKKGNKNRKSEFVLPEVTVLAGEILEKLVFYQDRAFNQDPLVYKRRFICGFKDVAKHIDTKEIKLIFLASDMESVDEPGGITDQMTKIRQKAQNFNLPIVFVMNRRLLARKCKKFTSRVSIVGIYNYDVVSSEVKKMLALVEDQRMKGNVSQPESSE